jgi:hypothetical protein
MNEVTNEKSQSLGAAWINQDGSISISLSYCCVLPTGPDIVITLFPADGKPVPRVENTVFDNAETNGYKPF